MIRCHLARMMGERKMRIADVARETGLSRATVTLLYKETAQKVDLEAIEQICILFDCTVGDLLELVPNLNDRGAAWWHLKQIPEQTISIQHYGQQTGNRATSFGSTTSLTVEKWPEGYVGDVAMWITCYTKITAI